MRFLKKKTLATVLKVATIAFLGFFIPLAASSSWLTSMLSGLFWLYLAITYIIDDYLDIVGAENFCRWSMRISGATTILSAISLSLFLVGINKNEVLIETSWQLLFMGIFAWCISFLGMAGIYLTISENYLRTIEDAMS